MQVVAHCAQVETWSTQVVEHSVQAVGHFAQAEALPVQLVA